MAKPPKKSRRREAALSSPAPKPAPCAVPRRATAERRLRILERLTSGLAVAHIAHVEGLSVQRIRRIIAEMLASREIDPAAGFVQVQIARISEAMIVAHTMMREGDLQAMDRFVRLTGELDRYHGFAPSEIPVFADAGRRDASPSRSANLPAANATPPVEAEAKFSWLQTLEKPRNEIGITQRRPRPIPSCSTKRAALRPPFASQRPRPQYE